jgi:uncharacterized membrane protein
MIESIMQALAGIPPEATAAILATLPLTELRGALPVALLVLELPNGSAYFWTVLGNLVPMFFIFWLLPIVITFARKQSGWLDNVLEKYFLKLKKKHGEKYSKWGAFFLMLFVAIPLPGSGVWTGSVLAVLFEIKPKLAMSYITIGLLIAGLLVMAITKGVFHGIQLV